MSEDEASEEKQLITLEEAKSDRSKCRTTDEKIAKGEWRVGIMAWRGGRQSMTWQKAKAFLQNCLLEECTKANSGTCKKTGHKFAKEEVRFVYSTGNTRSFLTIPAAKEIIGPIIDVVEDFEPSEFKGAEELPESYKAEFEKEFGISKGGNGKKTKRESAASKSKPDVEKPAPKKRKSGVKGKAEPKDDEMPSVWEVRPNQEELIGDPVKAEDPDQSSDEEGGEEALEKELALEDIKMETEDNGKGDALEDGELQPSQTSPMNAFEKQRQARIAANRERMLKMGILDDAEKIMPKNQAKPRTKPKGVAAKKAKEKYTGPRRTSARVQGLAADGQMIEHEGAGGRITYLNNPDHHRSGNHRPSPWEVTDSAEPPEPKERHSQEAIAFVPEEASHDVYAVLLDVLKSCKQSKTNSKAEKGKTALHKLNMKEEDLAKVTSNGISHVQWLPSRQHMVVAAGDKSGNLGVWNVDHQDPAEGNDGVYQFKPHYSYISGMRWAGGAQAMPSLYTSSYDGSLRCLDLTAEKFQLTISSEDAEFSAMDCTADGNVVFLGDNDGDVHIYDIREASGKSRGSPVELHNKRINTIHVEPGRELEILTASSDNSMSVWDLRKLDEKGKRQPLATTVHSKTCQSAYFAPDGSKRMVSLSRDDTVKIWQYSGSKLSVAVNIPHYNNTGRWVIPFRATWSPSSDSVLVGNMKRQVDLYDSSGNMLAQLESQFMTAIASRANAHPYHNAIAACTSSGRVHIYR